MASDKDNMLSSANYYVGIVASAKNLCSDAALALRKAVPKVEENWKGSSGTAMCDALTQLRMEVNMVHAQLNQLEEQMRAHARSIYSNWPEEIESGEMQD